MISEREGPNRLDRSLLQLSFDERQESGFFYKIRRSWDAARREEYAKACREAKPDDFTLNTVEDFHELCVRRFGSMLKAWRECLDNDHNGKLTFNEFCAALRRLGYA